MNKKIRFSKNCTMTPHVIHSRENTNPKLTNLASIPTHSPAYHQPDPITPRQGGHDSKIIPSSTHSSHCTYLQMMMRQRTSLRSGNHSELRDPHQNNKNVTHVNQPRRRRKRTNPTPKHPVASVVPTTCTYLTYSPIIKNPTAAQAGHKSQTSSDALFGHHPDKTSNVRIIPTNLARTQITANTHTRLEPNPSTLRLQKNQHHHRHIRELPHPSQEQHRHPPSRSQMHAFLPTKTKLPRSFLLSKRLYTSRTTKASRLRAARQFPDRLSVDHWSSKKSLQNSFTEDAIPQVVRLLPVNPKTHPRSASSFHSAYLLCHVPKTLAHQSSCQGDSKWVSAYAPRPTSTPTLGMLLHTFTVFARELPPPVPASVRSTTHPDIVNTPPKTCCIHQSLRNPHHYPPPPYTPSSKPTTATGKIPHLQPHRARWVVY
jgi:hypothetical protein